MIRSGIYVKKNNYRDTLITVALGSFALRVLDTWSFPLRARFPPFFFSFFVVLSWHCSLLCRRHIIVLCDRRKIHLLSAIVIVAATATTTFTSTSTITTTSITIALDFCSHVFANQHAIQSGKWQCNSDIISPRIESDRYSGGRENKYLDL